MTLHLATLADIEDKSAKPRAELPVLHAEIKQAEAKRASIEQAAAAAEAELSIAESQTAHFESAAERADEKHRVVAAAAAYAHMKRIALLRNKCAELRSESVDALAELDEEIGSLKTRVTQTRKRIVWAELENLVALKARRTNDSNIPGVDQAIRRKAWEAGIRIHDSRANPLLIDMDVSYSVEKIPLPLRETPEDFDSFYREKAAAEKADAEAPADDSEFQQIWQKVKKS